MLQYIINGKNNEEACSLQSVKTHINNLYKKLAVTHRKAAIERGPALGGGSGGAERRQAAGWSPGAEMTRLEASLD